LNYSTEKMQKYWDVSHEKKYVLIPPHDTLEIKIWVTVSIQLWIKTETQLALLLRGQFKLHGKNNQILRNDVSEGVDCWEMFLWISTYYRT